MPSGSDQLSYDVLLSYVADYVMQWVKDGQESLQLSKCCRLNKIKSTSTLLGEHSTYPLWSAW